jgi:hypothetical protein
MFRRFDYGYLADLLGLIILGGYCIYLRLSRK